MCRVCEGSFPTKAEYQNLRTKAKGLVSKWSKHANLAKNPKFIQDVVKLDGYRLSSGADWGNPGHGGNPIKLIFKNPNPDTGLLLYILCNWMDLQLPTERVWSELLEQANEWISGRGSMPRGSFNPVRPHLKQTWGTARKYGSISNWFAARITEIAHKHGRGSGNIYRIAGLIFRDLLDPSKKRKRNTRGQKELDKGRCALLDDWKRLWVLLRGLRRDNSLRRCLFTRALKTVSNGGKAIEYWYDDSYFDPMECQLPVDGWVRDNWISIMNSTNKLRRRNVAQEAKQLASRYNVSPSVFDVLFLAR